MLYSYRPNYDFEKTWKDNWSLSDRGGGGYYQTYDFRKLFTEDVDLMQEPLYRIKEIEIRDFVDNRHSESLSYNDMKKCRKYACLRAYTITPYASGEMLL